MRRAERSTLLFWQTRNWRHGRAMLGLCKNFGLQPLGKDLYIGLLSARERNMVGDAASMLLTKKTESFILFPLCKECADKTKLSENVKNGIFRAPFEIV